MRNKEKKIIVLSNLKSTNFEQAVFVLKDGQEESRSAVFEAERIVEEYIFPSSAPPPQKKERRHELDFLPFAVTAAVAVLAGIVAVVVNIL